MNVPQHTPTIPGERWLPLAEWPDYAVSDHGRVMRITQSRKGDPPGFILKPLPNSRGYLRVNFYRGKKQVPTFVHRLVIEAFTGKALDFMEVNHKDGNPTNNCLDNLEWVTPQENAFHSFDVLGRKTNGKTRLTNKQTSEIRQLYADGYTQTGIAEMYSVSQTHVWAIVHHYRRDAFETTTNPVPKRKELTDDQVRHIRASYRNPYLLVQLASIHHVSAATISRVVRYESHKDVT